MQQNLVLQCKCRIFVDSSFFLGDRLRRYIYIYMNSIEIVESMHGLQTERGLKHHRGPCCGLQDASPPKPKTIAAVRQAAESI